MKVAILSASVREGRQSHRVSLYLQKALDAREGIEPHLIDLAELPLPHLEYVLAKHPEPPVWLTEVKQKLDEADVILFVSPEYNGGYTSALKALVDHFPKSTYAKKPIGVATASSGMMGGMRAAQQLQQLVLALWAFPVPQMLLVGKVGEQLDIEGKPLNDSFGPRAETFLDEVLWLGEAVQLKKGQPQVPAGIH